MPNYILENYVDWEGGWIIGVYDTLPKAKKAANKTPGADGQNIYKIDFNLEDGYKPVLNRRLPFRCNVAKTEWNKV